MTDQRQPILKPDPEWLEKAIATAMGIPWTKRMAEHILNNWFVVEDMKALELVAMAFRDSGMG